MIYRYQRSTRNFGRTPSRNRKSGWLAGWGRFWEAKLLGDDRPQWRAKKKAWTTAWPVICSRPSRWTVYLSVSVLVLGFAVWGAGLFKGAIRRSDLFEVRQIRTAGLERLKKSDVMDYLPSTSGKTLFELDLASLQGRLLKEPWIKEVNVRKEYPDTLSVRVVERRPIAVLTGRPVGAIVDETGSVIEQWPGDEKIPTAWAGLPVIHGIDAAALRRQDPRAAAGFTAALDILRTGLMEEENDLDLDVNRIDDVRVHRHGIWIRLGVEPFDEKWRRFFSVENEIERRHDEVHEVDLRFQNRVIVR